MPRPRTPDPPSTRKQPHPTAAGHDRVTLALERDAALPPGITVDAATSAVMSVLAKRLTPGEAHELLEALPPYLQTPFRQCFIRRGREPVTKLDRAQAVAHVADSLGVTPGQAEVIATAVLCAMHAEVAPGLARNVARQLPGDLSALWLASSPVAPPRIPAPGTVGGSTRQLVEDEIERRARLPDNVTPDAAFKAVMDIFSQRLSGGEAFDVLLGLPDDLRRLTEGSVLGRDEHASVFGRDTLVGAIALRLRIAHDDAEAIVFAVLAAVKCVLPVKEIDDVADELPADLRDLWLAAT